MKTLPSTLLMFIASLMLFFAVVYAWFTITDVNVIQPLSQGIIERDVQMDILYGMNGGGYESFDEPAQINAFLNGMMPGDRLDIQVIIQNNNPIGTPDILLFIKMMNIRASFSESEYDLTDYFFLLEREITLTWYDSDEDYQENLPSLIQVLTLNALDDSEIVVLGKPLYESRLSNLFHQNTQDVIENDIHILNTQLATGKILVITFSIGLDPYTPGTVWGLQHGSLFIDGLYASFAE